MFNILVVEDNPNTRKLMTALLEKNGYKVKACENAIAALDMMDREHIDLILLDIMMPGMDGYAFTEELRGAGITTPILMATAKQLPADMKQGFSVGADDYMTKPVDTDEMLWRIEALLRRAQIVNSQKLTIGKITLDYNELSVTRANNRQVLPNKEFMLLYKLLSHPNRIFTRIQLMDEIWGLDSDSESTTVNVHINRLRRRFESFPEFKIVAVRGLGYKAVVES